MVKERENLGEKFEKINTRTITVIIGIPIILLIIHFGGVIFYTTLIIIALLAFLELWYILKQKIFHPSLIPGLALMFFFLFQQKILDFNLNIKLILTILFFLIILEHFFLNPQKYSIINIALTIFAAFYIGHFLSYIIEMRELTNGKILLIFSLFCTWVNDIAAYLMGINFGKKHPFPYLSPNKTLQGAIGGTIAGGIFALTFYSTIPLTVYTLLLLGLIAAICGQIGDLFESLIKRNFEVKDSGKLLPGHGGLLDGIDSILFSVPVLYYIFLIIL